MKTETVTLGSLLNKAAEAERHLERYCASIRDVSKDNDVRLLTYYLAHHRHHQAQTLRALDPAVLERILALEVNHNVPFGVETELGLFDVAPDAIDAKALLDLAVAHDNRLLGLYGSLSKLPLMSDKAREVLESLVCIKEREVVMIRKMLAMEYF